MCGGEVYSCLSQLGRLFHASRRQCKNIFAKAPAYESKRKQQTDGDPRPRPASHTCADEAGEASVDDFVIVGQYERTPGLHLQTILLAWNRLSAVKLCDFKVLGAEPGFVDNLKSKESRVSSVERTLHTSLVRKRLGWESMIWFHTGQETTRRECGLHTGSLAWAECHYENLQ